ncbi:MAG: cyclic nucleotide-binding domain-containing protein [Spirochaetales bacterium]
MDPRAVNLQKSLLAFQAGDVIFREGEPGENMYIVLDGEVEILKQAGGGSSKVLATVGKGAFFGEMALIEDRPRSASAVATTEGRLLVMSDALLDSYIVTNPEFAAKMIRNLAQRLRGANKLIEQALVGNTLKVVQEGLVDWARENGTDTVRGTRVSIPAFSAWASQHLGVPERNIPDLLKTLLERGILVPSALGEQEVIYPKK